VAERQRWIDQHIGRDRSQDQGLDYGIDLWPLAFDRTAFLPRPLDGWAPVSRLREG
jgi:hypothetical protein